LLDEDFAEIFKVKAEFDPEMSLDAEAGVMLGRLLKKLEGEEKDMLVFQAEGVAELLRTAVRLAGDKDKLTSEFSRIADVAREASYWAGLDGVKLVDSTHVRQATEESVYRSDLVATKVREWIA
ncbi:MAG: AAA family ATPase, partial [Akkermansiaceae bacterium]|nr:AAA family ATPase [Akkermansiaceae bacterium]